MSIRTRLALWNVGILAFLLLGMGCIFRARVKAQGERSLDAELLRRTRIIPARKHLKFPKEDFPKDKPPPKIPIFDAKGRSVLGNTTPVDPDALQAAYTNQRDVFSNRGGERVLSHPVTFADGTRLVFQTSESVEPMRKELANLTRELLLLLPVGVLAAGLGGLFLTARALQPVRAITEAANSMDASDLSRRLPEAGKDEFAQLTRTLNRMLGRLDDAFSRQRRFVADASHELKTPLTIVSGAAQLGLTEESASPASRQLFTRIDDASQRMSRLVGGLLELARGTTELGPLALKPVPMLPLLCAAAEEARLLHPEGAPIQLLVEPSTQAAGDTDSLIRLLLNLLDNALRHTPATGAVVLGAEPDSNGIRLFVRDTGPGVAEEALPRLGEPFFRPDAARARRDGGTGLGLAICKQIAERHGSTLLVESEVGRGTEVSVRLKRIPMG